MTKIDLRNNIETHCNGCSHTDTDMCETCFFANVDMGDPLLGGLEQYNRAFCYLKKHNTKGFKRNKAFGNFLNIPTLVG